MSTLSLKSFEFADLHSSAGLAELDARFLATLKAQDASLHERLLAYRQGGFTAQETSQLVLDGAPLLEQFIAELFQLEKPVAALTAETVAHAPIFIFKNYYLRQAKRRLTSAQSLDFSQLHTQLLTQLTIENHDLELAICRYGQSLLQDEKQQQAAIDALIDWCVAALTTSAGRALTQHWVSLKLPKRLDFANLVKVAAVQDDELERLQADPQTFRQRDGFDLTDQRMNAREVQSEIDYCVYCHKNEGDFCSKGFPVKKNDPQQGLKTSPVGDVLTGCPLEEKISEMHVLKKSGFSIAALATVMVDNPMCAATGHRICNDCMKACIYQKQEPVDIPQVETHVLTDVLSLPWGVEIYDLLMKWNPLRDKQYLPKAYNGLKVLVMGMGPAGFTMAHHLLMEGFAVVGMDGLKLEPLPDDFHNPIKEYATLQESLSRRVMSGFGGVAEYGITSRWDKNFLKLIYISLMRRKHFQVFGSVRFGGSLKLEDAWQMGFDHFCIAVGAGLPRELHVENSLAPGMRQANDFLMALQLTGAAKSSSLANLQVRLPAVIIGGGLTGVDTATEVQAYYIKQVEKIQARYQILSQSLGEARVREHFDENSLLILDEFLQHAQAVAQERALAEQEKREVDFIQLIHAWGGVSVVYRRQMQASPAYRRNHEELAKALEEGVFYAEGLQPVAVKLDNFGDVKALVCQAKFFDEEGNWVNSDQKKVLPARAIFVATGAQPNIAYEFEHRGTFARAHKSYRTYQDIDNKLHAIEAEAHCKLPVFGPFTSYAEQHHRVSFIGDTHPMFHGSVVKAIASAKRSYEKITQSLARNIKSSASEEEYAAFAANMQDFCKAKVVDVKRHSADIVELIVRAPLAAKNFQPGQFYRIQNYERLAQRVENTRLQTEALALIGIPSVEQPENLSFLVKETGASSRLVATFSQGQFLSVMGPTGNRAHINDENKTILLIGDVFAAAHLRSLGPAWRARNNRVLFVMHLTQADELIWQKEIEQACDAALFITSHGDPVKTHRQQDAAFVGDLISGLLHYDQGDLHAQPIRLADIDRIMLVGNSCLLKKFRQAQADSLKPHLKNPQVTASVYSSMQCMLKGVCAQCLQWQIDPQTGKRTKAVYACSWQDQPLAWIDIDNLDERQRQNRVQEVLGNLWLDHLFAKHALKRV